MKLTKSLIFLVTTMAFVAVFNVINADKEEAKINNVPTDDTLEIASKAVSDEDHVAESSLLSTPDLPSTRRSMGQKKRRPYTMTCDKYPRVCGVIGSRGPDCCGKRCVNVSTDRFNCGRCGRRCRYWETCCDGYCVNPRYDPSHCGGCNNKCKKGSKCVYGMCNYG